MPRQAMMVKVIKIQNPDVVKGLLRSFRWLGDARLEWPHLRPKEFMTPGTYPAARWQVKLYCLVMHPGKAWYEANKWNRPEDVALTAAYLLEERRGVRLDWAAGYRKSGAVWLFVKPWAWDRATGRRAWFRPSPEDLGVLRGLCLANKSNKVKTKRERSR